MNGENIRQHPILSCSVIRNVASYPAFPVVSNDLSGLSRTGIICDGRGVLRKLISFL